jgi:hypothetical protein
MCEKCYYCEIIEDPRGNKIFKHYAQDAHGNLVLILKEADAFLNGAIKFRNHIREKQGKEPEEHIEYYWLE